MEESKNKDFGLFCSKVDRIRKSSEETPPEVTVHLSVKQWIMGEFTGAGIENAKEFLPEPTGLLFVPRIASHYISLDFGKKM